MAKHSEGESASVRAVYGVPNDIFFRSDVECYAGGRRGFVTSEELRADKRDCPYRGRRRNKCGWPGFHIAGGVWVQGEDRARFFSFEKAYEFYSTWLSLAADRVILGVVTIMPA